MGLKNDTQQFYYYHNHLVIGLTQLLSHSLSSVCVSNVGKLMDVVDNLQMCVSSVRCPLLVLDSLARHSPVRTKAYTVGGERAVLDESRQTETETERR